MSLKRKIKREAQKGSKKDFSKKVGLFNKIPDSCLTCDKEFDKKNKEMVMSWNVIVREKKGVGRLYCPDCWDTAKRVIAQYNEDKKDE